MESVLLLGWYGSRNMVLNYAFAVLELNSKIENNLKRIYHKTCINWHHMQPPITAVSFRFISFFFIFFYSLPQISWNFSSCIRYLLVGFNAFQSNWFFISRLANQAKSRKFKKEKQSKSVWRRSDRQPHLQGVFRLICPY